jgi:hypothetical protein
MRRVMSVAERFTGKLSEWDIFSLQKLAARAKWFAEGIECNCGPTGVGKGGKNGV